jgi:cytochrome c
VLLIVLFALLPCMAADNDATVVELVDKAVALWADKGKDHAIKVMNASAGPLRKGSLYVFASDFRGQTLAHPVQEALRGQDAWELQDAKGKFFVQDFVKVAKSKEGMGWVEYDWIRVNETEPTKKRAYLKRIPAEDIFVGCGYYVK